MGLAPRSTGPSSTPHIFLGACVCRPVGRKEIKANQAAGKASQQEWARLQSRKAWGESNPREWGAVANEAKENKQDVQVGVAFGVVVEKNTDLPGGDPRRKFKGRVAFQGHIVKNQRGENAVFVGLGSSPFSMETGSSVDALGLRPNTMSNTPTLLKRIFKQRSEGDRRGCCYPEISGLQRGRT